MYQGPGIYEHYKGKQYFVVGLALHTETGEEMVIYLPMYVGQGKVTDGPWAGYFIRPRKMFDDMFEKHSAHSSHYQSRFSALKLMPVHTPAEREYIVQSPALPRPDRE